MNSSSDLRSIFIGEEERFLRNVRLRRGQYIRQNRRNLDSYIGRGTHYLTGASRDASNRREGRSIYFNNETDRHRNMLSNSRDRDETNIDKRSKKKLARVYESFKWAIPKHWRKEELSKQRVITEDFLVSYLEKYGALAVLIFLRC